VCTWENGQCPVLSLTCTEGGFGTICPSGGVPAVDMASQTNPNSPFSPTEDFCCVTGRYVVQRPFDYAISCLRLSAYTNLT
jgi:hypothetical protein